VISRRGTVKAKAQGRDRQFYRANINPQGDRLIEKQRKEGKKGMKRVRGAVGGCRAGRRSFAVLNLNSQASAGAKTVRRGRRHMYVHCRLARHRLRGTATSSRVVGGVGPRTPEAIRRCAPRAELALVGRRDGNRAPTIFLRRGGRPRHRAAPRADGFAGLPGPADEVTVEANPEGP